MKLTFVASALLAVSAAQAITLIDDFSSPYTNSVQTGTWVDSHSASVLGGERDVQFTVHANPFNQFADMDLQGIDLGIFSNGFGMESTFTLQYDRAADEAGNLGPGKTLKNGGTGVALLPAGSNEICLYWLGNDLDVRTTVTARLSGAVVGTGSGTRAGGSGTGLQFISVAGMDKGDSITVEFRGVTNADFGVGKIEAVPEPATLLGIFSGSLLLYIKRRRR